MNHVLREGAAMTDLGWLMGAMTVLFLVAYVGWFLWAYAPSRKSRMEEAGRIPFDDEVQ